MGNVRRTKIVLFLTAVAGLAWGGATFGAARVRSDSMSRAKRFISLVHARDYDAIESEFAMSVEQVERLRQLDARRGPVEACSIAEPFGRNRFQPEGVTIFEERSGKFRTCLLRWGIPRTWGPSYDELL